MGIDDSILWQQLGEMSRFVTTGIVWMKQSRPSFQSVSISLNSWDKSEESQSRIWGHTVNHLPRSPWSGWKKSHGEEKDYKTEREKSMFWLWPATPANPTIPAEFQAVFSFSWLGITLKILTLMSQYFKHNCSWSNITFIVNWVSLVPSIEQHTYIYYITWFYNLI